MSGSTFDRLQQARELRDAVEVRRERGLSDDRLLTLATVDVLLDIAESLRALAASADEGDRRAAGWVPG